MINHAHLASYFANVPQNHSKNKNKSRTFENAEILAVFERGGGAQTLLGG